MLAAMASLLTVVILVSAGFVQETLSLDLAYKPLGDLNLVPSETFVALGHPAFPKYSVRVKQSDFCDGTVRAFTGYIDIEARHLFFYFFESRRDPARDDVIFWTNGGPGCSSAEGLFTELGPCSLKDSQTLVYNPYSWNEYANVFFIDQPIGTGFSYADHGETVNTTEEAAKDIAAFVAIFFEHFDSFKGRAFHMAGESYAGRAVPVYASEIYDQNARLQAAGMTPINLTSIMLGNGCTDWRTALPSYYDMQCRNVSVPPILSIQSCVSMKRALPRCEQWLQEHCYDTRDPINCAAAYKFCDDVVVQPFYEAWKNPYDLSKDCIDPAHNDTLCYPIIQEMHAYLDRADVRAALGVDAAHTAHFAQCNLTVVDRFERAQDKFFPTQLHLGALLARGVRVLVYVGANDLVCSWVGNERMTRELEWSGQDRFAAQALRPWTVDGRVAGLTRAHGGLTFATVDGAGHMAPQDKPREALEMLRRWLAVEDL